MNSAINKDSEDAPKHHLTIEKQDFEKDPSSKFVY